MRVSLLLLCGFAGLSACDPNIVLGTRLGDSSSGGSGNETSVGGAAGDGDGNSGGNIGGASVAGAAGSDTGPVNVVWSTSHETGDDSDWLRGGASEGERYVENVEFSDVSTQRPRTGKYSMKITIDTTPRRTHIGRYFRGTTAGAGYYSGWFFFETLHVPDVWWTFFIFRGLKEPGNINTNVNLWDVNIENERGKLYVYLYDQVNDDVRQALVRRPIPIGEWVHFEAFFDASLAVPRIKLWQNGELVLDADKLGKSETSNIYWGVGNGSNGLNPQVSTLFMDDLVIADGRVGTDGPGN